jgi:hypothetical protein
VIPTLSDLIDYYYVVQHKSYIFKFYFTFQYTSFHKIHFLTKIGRVVETNDGGGDARKMTIFDGRAKVRKHNKHILRP